MNEASQNQRFAPSGIECRETEGQLELNFPARGGRAVLRIAGTLLVSGGFIAFVIFFLWGEVPPLWMLSPVIAVVTLCLAFSFAIVVGNHLTKTSLLITPDSLTLTTVLFGKEDVERHVLHASSRAQQLIGPKGARFNGPKMRWIQIDTQEGEARLGYALSKAEQEWVERRINQFLDQAVTKRRDEAPRIGGVSSRQVQNRTVSSRLKEINEASQNHLLADSGIECRETEGQLELYFPARGGRALLRVAQISLFVGGFFAFFFFLNGEVPPLLFLLPLLGVGSVCLALLFFVVVGQHLTATSLLITPDSLVLTTVVFGKKDVERHALGASSCAQRLIGPTRARSNGWKMQWIQIDTQDGEVCFGYELLQAEQDCVEQRINRFLGRAAEGLMDEALRG